MFDRRAQEQNMMVTYGTDHLTVEEFRKIFEEAAPGDVIVYAIGDLSTSRHCRIARPDLNMLGKKVWRLAESGDVLLTQRPLDDKKFRIGGGRCFEYRATKCQANGSILKRLPHSSLLAEARATA
jgi:hypothetical protein